MARRSSLLYYIILILIGFLYPGYCSLIALQTPDKNDDHAWLMYWTVFAIFNLLEGFADVIFGWLPFYSTAKLGFIAWCVAPLGTNGAYYIYKAFVAPLFNAYGDDLNYYLREAGKLTYTAMETTYSVTDSLIKTFTP